MGNKSLNKNIISMKTISSLDKIGVQQMTARELTETEGGIFFLTLLLRLELLPRNLLEVLPRKK